MTDTMRDLTTEDREWIDARADQLFRESERQRGGVRPAAVMPQDFRDYFVAQAAWERARAALAAAPQPAPEDGTAECEVAWVTDSLWAHKPAPQTAPMDREALVEVIGEVLRSPDGIKDYRKTEYVRDKIAAALLARGLRLPSQPETLAWAVVGKDGKLDAYSVTPHAATARSFTSKGERVVRVAIRVVEGGDGAA